jgi:hypothetical protein
VWQDLAMNARRAALVLFRGLVAVTVGLEIAAHGQQASTAPDNLALVAGLVGKWTGTGEGEPGKSTVEREYTRVLGGKFVQVRNRSTYPPQEKNPKGEVHEDLGMMSFDAARKTVVLRQFHVEGFVNQYTADAGSTPARIVFTSEAIENITPGWRARETYVLSGPDRFEETFELSEPGKPFAVYTKNTFTRVK